MAIHRLFVPATAFLPDTSGNCYPKPSSIDDANDRFPHEILAFKDSGTRIGASASFLVPKNYVGGAQIIVVWTSTATAGDVEWDCDYRAVGGNDTESLDQAGTQESVNLNDTAPSAAHERMEVALALTATNLAADDEVEFELFRDGTDAGDTMAAAAIVFAVLFEYADA